MDTKKLRQKILDLAIRGKLVPQDPNDEPASVLLERIRAEKERLIKEGKIKRSKKTASDDEIEAPFEIPESWEWTTIEDLLINRDSERVPLSLAIRKKQTNKLYDYYGAAGVIDKVNGYLFSERLLLIGEDGANLLSRSKDNAFFADGQYWVNNHAHVLDCSEKYILDFVAFVINSMSLEKYVTGSAQPKLTQDNLNKIIISLPPKEEQRRIINEVERWFTLIDELESNEGDLLKTIDKAKSKILDLAIHGKLVPQDPNDEPAIESLKRINPKFEPCDMEECLFAIPHSWEWVCGIDIFESMKSSSPSGENFKYIDIDTIDNKCHQIKSVKQIQTKDAPSRASRYTEKGNVLFSMVRPYLRNIAMVPENNCIASTGFFVCREKPCLNNSFCLYLMLSNYVVNGLNAFMKGDNSPSINKGQIESFLFPLPPLKEQKRIVAKIEELFAVLDSIKESTE